MKKNKLFGIIALVAVIGFLTAACDTGNGNGPGNGPGTDTDPDGATFSVSGKFNKAGGDEVKFSLSDKSSAARSARAVTAESYAVSGELEDGDIVFRLSGTYDPVGLSYTASASSSFIRYAINGAFDDEGNSLGSTATLLVRNSPTSDDWSAFSYVIDETATVAITGTPTTEVVTGGIPAGAQGWWSFSDEYGSAGSDGSHETYTMDVRVLFSQWTIDQEAVTTAQSDGSKVSNSMRASVVEAENKGGYYDFIMGYPDYNGKATAAQVRAAVLQYLSENNLTAEERNSWPESNWNPEPPWIQEWEANGSQGEMPLPPWLESFADMGAVIDAKQDGTLPAIPSQYQEHAWYYNDLYDTDFPMPRPPQSTYPPFYIIGDGNVMFGGTFAPNALNKWYNGYLERYVIALGTVTPDTVYQKVRLSYTSTSITIGGYYTVIHNQQWNYDEEVSTFDTVAEARAATSIDTENSTTMTR